MTLIVLLNLAWDQASQHMDADVKYRRMKLFGQMQKDVIQEEDRRQAELERLEKLEDNRGEVKELERGNEVLF